MKTEQPVTNPTPVDPSGPESAVIMPWRNWERFWFSAADPATLGMIRLCVGLVTVYVHLVYCFNLQDLMGKDAFISLETVTQMRKEAPVPILPGSWSDKPLKSPTAEERKYVEDYIRLWGHDPRGLYSKGNLVWSVWYHVTDPTWMAIVHGCVLVVMVLFTIGFCTRVTSVLTWLMALCYVQRAPTTLFGMDTMMIIALTYLMIGPSGAALSVDRLIARWWARRQGRKEQRSSEPERLVSANFAIRLIQIHFCIIYLISGLSKLQGSAWWNGTALWGTMANASFNPLTVSWYRELLCFLCEHRWLWELVMGGGTAFTLILEIGLPFLIWNRQLRWIMVIGAVLLHTGIALVMGLSGFGLFMLCLLFSFVPSDAVRRMFAAASRAAERPVPTRRVPTAGSPEQLAWGR